MDEILQNQNLLRWNQGCEGLRLLVRESQRTTRGLIVRCVIVTNKHKYSEAVMYSFAKGLDKFNYCFVINLIVLKKLD